MILRPLIVLLLVLGVAMGVFFLMPRKPERTGIVWDSDFVSRTVRQGDALEEKFEFTNNTGRTISIVEAVPSCSCASVKSAPKTIPDRGRGSVTVRIDTAKRKAPASVRAIVRYDSGEPSVLTFKAELQGTVRLSTDQLKWTPVDAGKSQWVALDFSEASDADYLSYDISGGGYRVEQVSGSNRRVDFQVTPEPAAPKEAFLRLHWRQGRNPFVSNVLLINRPGE